MSESSGSGSMRSRVEEHRYKIWVLTRLNRYVLAVAVAGLVFGTLVGLSVVGPTAMRSVIETADALWWVFSPMITAIITAVSLVVTFNQLVLSQELGALGDQRTRMQDASAFQSDLEPWLTDAITPPDPASFLAAILESVQKLAETVEQTTPQAHEEVQDFATNVKDDAHAVGNELAEAQFGTFDVTFAALNFNYSWKIYEARNLLVSHGQELPADALDALQGVVYVLEFYGPAREHIKTLYFQWELVNLSRAMLYTAIPAITVAISMQLYVDPVAFRGTVLGVDNIVWVVCLAVTVTLFPFFILLSYVLRIATVTKRTLAIGPLVLRETERSS